MFLIVLEQNIMLFIYLFIGFFLAKFNKLSSIGIKEASFFLSNFALTCAVLDSFQTPFTKEKLFLILQSLLVALIFILFSIVISYLVTILFNVTMDKQAVWRGCCIFSSILFIGIPIVEALYGGVGLIMLVSFNTVFNLFLFGVGESIFSGKITISIKKVLRTPAIIGMLIGLVLFLLDIQLPIFLGTPIKVMGSFTAPLAMILNGAMFYGSPILKLLKNKDILSFCVVRLILLPVIAMFAFKPFIQNELLFSLLVLVAAMPSGSMNSIFAEMYQGKGQLASNYIIVSTLFSLITIPVMITISSLL